MASEVPKQYLRLGDRTVLEHSLSHFTSRADIAGIFVALAPHDPYWPELSFAGKSELWRVAGGAERAHTVRNALRELARVAAPEDWVLVHDAARPCLHRDDLDRLIGDLELDPVGGILATPARDTCKRVGADGRIAETVDRQALWLAQTPQMFRLRLLIDAIDAALARGCVVTDESSAMELAGHQPRIIEGRADNLKITRPEDLPLAEFMLAHQPT
ncbi:2-C-methyl-D-erythritol 4-phosphate cytidylyltransferase [Acidihalobacter prosperus]|uniref:2-C-methyl-D-erythritol 4-phosphate cytidylyltransferase n=2 Tax=Acidihalobacter prosperus TaxID=160660 RepID=A0A1A6C7W9_9GAMM|nr:2-C-methyl-D-erythritol 4-phosphate cytidylyltransferase [Acidihalobacter prosperus]